MRFPRSEDRIANIDVLFTDVLRMESQDHR